MALAIDPFSQQVIRYYSCSRPIPGALGTIPRTTNYTKTGLNAGKTRGSIATLDDGMTTALYVGLLNPSANVSSQLSVLCSTGNCTFGPPNVASYSSLAMCGSCSDISSQARSSNNASNGTYYEPYDFYLDKGPKVNGVTMFAATTSPIISSDSSPSNQSIFSFQALMTRPASCGYSKFDPSCAPPPYAIQCDINPCVQTYSASITNGEFKENVLKVSPLNTASLTTSGDEFDLALISDSVSLNGQQHDCKPSDQATDTHPVHFDRHISDAVSHTQYYPLDCIYLYGGQARTSLAYTLKNKFFNLGSLNVSYQPDPSAAEGPQWFKRLYREGKADNQSVTASINGLTNAMTAVIRQNGGTSSSGYAKGNVFASETCIHIQWAWLSLPATLLVLAVAFLVVVMVETTAYKHAVTWKSSSLGLIMHGLDGNGVQWEYNRLEKIQDMDDTAKLLRVRLTDESGRGWRLSE